MADKTIFRGVNSIKFHNRFKYDNDYLIYLSEIKWAARYKCKRCKNEKFGNGKNPQNRRCTKCGYDESPTTGTGSSFFIELQVALISQFVCHFPL